MNQTRYLTVARLLTSFIKKPMEQEVDIDVHALFLDFNRRYFDGHLQAVEVKWSTRMTSCAGVCAYQQQGRGRTQGWCSIRLSEPLLKFRPLSDLIDTLLHEMIHAYLFLTEGSVDREGHGPSFLFHMNRINQLAGTKITVYHSFIDEVDYYRRHIWRCTGPCQHRPPYFGFVKRAMNRPPQPADFWFKEHQSTCGGTFIKLAGDEPGASGSSGSGRKRPKKSDVQGSLTSSSSVKNENNTTLTASDSGALIKWLKGSNESMSTAPTHGSDKSVIDLTGNDEDPSHVSTSQPSITNTYHVYDRPVQVTCPACGRLILESRLNAHLDTCLK